MPTEREILLGQIEASASAPVAALITKLRREHNAAREVVADALIDLLQGVRQLMREQNAREN